MVRSTTPLDITKFWLDALGDRNSNSHKLDEVQERNDEKDLHHKKKPTRTMPLSKPVHRG